VARGDGRLSHELLPGEKGPQDACGVFGVWAPGEEVANLTYFGLYALQHRGQEAAGMAVSDGTTVVVYKELGLVAQVFDESTLSALHGHLAVGHCRYSTTGSCTWENAQPSYRPSAHGGGIALGHNGNLVNASELRGLLDAEGVRLSSTSDTELIAALIASDPAPLQQAVADAMARLEGAYSVTAIAEGKLLAFRDPRGFRPLCLGRLGDDWVVASETCALDLLGAEYEREVEPGELVVVDDDGLHSSQAVPRADDGALCIFEFFYLARPDSRLDGVEMHGARVRMGERLAEEAPVDADLVLPIPDSGTPAAIGFSRASGIPFSEGLIKNRYVGRTFIQPDQRLRQQGIRLKFNPLDELAGKRVVVVDDSIVRGNTTQQLVAMLFDTGATEVHLRISSPPIVGPCFYGIDFADEDELIAAGRTVEEVREHIGATSLAYLSLEGLQEATHRPSSSLCRACLTGEYPTRIPDSRRLAKLRFEPARA
jgi:amidophosphoribosyltransferase